MKQDKQFRKSWFDGSEFISGWVGGKKLSIFIFIQNVVLNCIFSPPIEVILFPGRLRPGKRIASIGTRFCVYYI